MRLDKDQEFKVSLGLIVSYKSYRVKTQDAISKRKEENKIIPGLPVVKADITWAKKLILNYNTNNKLSISLLI